MKNISRRSFLAAAAVSAAALALTACGRQAEEDDGKVVYVPMWMEPYSVVYYDADLNRTVAEGGDLTEEEINSREDIFPEEMYTIAAEPNTKVEYDLHGFIQNIYYRGGDGAYYLDPATAAAMQP